MEIRNLALKKASYEEANLFMRKLTEEDLNRLIIFANIDLAARQNKARKLPKVVVKELNSGIIKLYWQLVKQTKNYIEENYSIKRLKLSNPNASLEAIKKMQAMHANEYLTKLKEKYELQKLFNVNYQGGC